MHKRSIYVCSIYWQTSSAENLGEGGQPIGKVVNADTHADSDYRTEFKYVRNLNMFGTVCEFSGNNNGRLSLYNKFMYVRQGSHHFRTLFAPLFDQI